jgi:hypothetical protein
MERRVVAAVLLCTTVSAGACGSNRAADCVEIREAVDPGSFTHVIDPDVVTYRTHPPTSGPHVAVPTPSGVLPDPLAAPLQVRILESGGVLVQHEEVDSTTVAALEGLAGDGIVVAPGVDLPAPVVATAWTWKLTCDQLDIDALDEFIETRRSAAPGSD